MKTVFILLVLPSLCFSASLQENWKVIDGISAPESAYFDPTSGFIFISNVAGKPDGKDGKGWITKLTGDGKIVKSKWIDGLNAPKGLRSKVGVLWVTDIDRVIAIDIAKGKITKKIPVPGSKFLNDLAIGEDGTIYVSDTPQSRIYQIKNGTSSKWAEGPSLDNPNGLLVKDGFLYVAAWGLAAKDWSTKIPGSLYKLDLKTKAKTLITPEPLGNLDGLEIDEQGNFLVSDWAKGKVFRVTQAGVHSEILSDVKNAADIGYLEKGRVLLVPAMGGDEVTAYKIE